MVIGQVKEGDRVCTNFSLKLLGTSLSTRKSEEHKEYLPGKIRQEFVLLHFGHLMSIQTASTQYKRVDAEKHPEEHFTLTIMQNPLITTTPLKIFTRNDLSKEPESLNTRSRQRQLQSFLDGEIDNSPLQDHRETMHLLEKIKETIQCEAFL